MVSRTVPVCLLLPAPNAISNDVMCVFSSLQAAGNAVKRASDNLVRAAQKAAFGKMDDDDVVVKTKFVGGIAQVSDGIWNCICSRASAVF